MLDVLREDELDVAIAVFLLPAPASVPLEPETELLLLDEEEDEDLTQAPSDHWPLLTPAQRPSLLVLSV